MKFKVGDVVVNARYREPIYREITHVRDTGYTWIYHPVLSNEDFWTENSNDPFLEQGWELVEITLNQIFD